MLIKQRNCEKKMKEKTQKEILKQLIDRRKKEIFVEGYDGKDEETLGIIISQYFEWTGETIIDTFLHALEDSNFHTLAGQISELTGRDI